MSICNDYYSYSSVFTNTHNQKHKMSVRNFWIFQVGNVAGQFTAAPPTCPGDTFVFRCTVGVGNAGVTIWRVSRSNECILAHSTVDAPYSCGSGSAFTARSGTGFGTSAPLFSSTLSGTANSELNGTLVECFGPALSRDETNTVGKSMLQILGQYYFLLSDWLIDSVFIPFLIIGKYHVLGESEQFPN